MSEVTERVSLRTRIGLLAAVMVGLAAAGVSATAFYVVRNSMYHDLDNQLTIRAETVVSTGLLARPDFLPAAALYGEDIRVGVLTTSKSMSIPVGSRPPPVGQPELDVASGQLTHSLRTVSDQRVLAVPAGGHSALILAQPMASMRHTLGGLGVVLALVGAAGVVLAGVAGAAVAGAGLRPVRRLTSATERVASTGDLRPIPVTGSDELARLTHSFNVMLGAVAAARDQQRRLVADAGHELRTPLTSMRTNVELLIAAGMDTSPGSLPEADRKEIFDDVQGQLEELSTLVGDLVELARDDPPQAVNQRVDLVEVIERALQRARRRAGEVSFEQRLQPWTLPGDATALERAVLNLLDNAVKYSPPDGTVRVGLHPVGDGTAMLEVADSGPGIASADQPHVFERFYRATEDRGRPGSGLGLSIVKQVAERHGGSVRAGQSADGGALLAMQLTGEPGGEPT